jgi:hypothetical protein
MLIRKQDPPIPQSCWQHPPILGAINSIPTIHVKQLNQRKQTLGKSEKIKDVVPTLICIEIH